MKKISRKNRLVKALVIGFGSIGQRHARVLKELGCSVAMVSRRKIAWQPSFADLRTALAISKPDYAVIANRTGEHFQTLQELKTLGFKGTVLVEKPLFEKPRSFDPSAFKKVVVGYNLRLHPLIVRLRSLLKGRTIYSAQAYVGKDLTAWRPHTDYRRSYSASRIQGGGVLRDLSHELDYMTWILGGWKSVTAVGGHYSQLEIKTDDVFSVLVKTPRCESVYIQVNYVDLSGHREIILNAEGRTVKADLLNGWIEVNGRKETFRIGRNDTYRAEHKAVLASRWNKLCSYREAIEIMRLISASENAAKAGKWIKK